MVKVLGMTNLPIAFLCLCSVILAGCSSGRNETNQDLFLNTSGAIVDAVRSRRANTGPTIDIVPSRADLDATQGQVLQVRPENLGVSDFLRRIETRLDGFGSPVEVWQSSDNRLIILRGGVLVGTKGLGGDMRSADATPATNGFDGQGGGGERLVVIDKQDGTALSIPFACDMTQLGTEVIQIVDQRVTTRRIREECVYRGTSFTNDYWVEPGRKRVRKSRQWAGPENGYFDMTLLKN